MIVVSDDPGAHSSVKEEDTRYLAPPAHIPLLEPSSPVEAKDMVNWAFQVSEESRLPVIVRLVTRICHARSTVTLGPMMKGSVSPDFPVGTKFVTAARFHGNVHQRLDLIKDRFLTSPFNQYEGPERPALMVFVSGVSHLYALEAVERLDAVDRVGIFKLGTLWPAPERLILENLKRSDRVLFLEEIEPFIEDQAKIIAAQQRDATAARRVHGKALGRCPMGDEVKGHGRDGS